MTGELTFEAHLEKARHRIETSLAAALDSLEGSTAPRLLAAMRHSLLGGGKRLRAILCHWTCRGVAGSCTPASHQAALSLEMLHAYSLIHDDLPAMDDDELRRGKATCHVAFDEATAILAGDALQAEAFRLLGQVCPAELGSQLVMILADAAGAQGMVAGQQYDLDSEGARPEADQLLRIHRLKTGRLLGAAMGMGALSGGLDPQRVVSVRTAGEELGVAFQIVDDLLDLRSNAAELGKNPHQDSAHEKLTAVSVWGEEDAELRARRHLDQAKQLLETTGVLHPDLEALCDFLVTRER